MTVCTICLKNVGNEAHSHPVSQQVGQSRVSPVGTTSANEDDLWKVAADEWVRQREALLARLETEVASAESRGRQQGHTEMIEALRDHAQETSESSEDWKQRLAVTFFAAADYLTSITKRPDVKT